MIFGRPELQVNLILVMAVCFQLDIDLLRVIFDRIVITGNFLDDIVSFYCLITDNRTGAVTTKISIMNAERSEFNLISCFAGLGITIGVRSFLNLIVIILIHLIHFEGEFTFLQIRWQFTSILISKRLRDVYFLFYMGAVMPIMVIEMPFFFRNKIILGNNPAGTCTFILFNMCVRGKENTSSSINR